MKARMNGRLPLLSLFVFLTACSSVTVSVDWDREVDFRSYRTFAFLRRPEGGRGQQRQMGPLVTRHAESAIRAELAAKGLTEATGEKPDLRVAIHSGAQQKLDVERYGYVGPRGYWHNGGATVTRYTEGRLTIDLVDTASRSLVWRGIGKAVLDDDPGQKIRDIVHEVLKEYPPKS